MADWNETSEIGFEFEKFCVEELKKKVTPFVEINEQKEEMSFYDITIRNPDDIRESKSFECKYDKKSTSTGNICIETGCNGKLSGLTLTKADYWLYGDEESLYLIETDNIRKCINDNFNQIRYVKNCPVMQETGIAKSISMYLIPVNMFTKYCLEISTLNNITFDSIKFNI